MFFVVLVYNKVMNIDLTPYRNKRICVALSGGGDSVALFIYLTEHCREYNIVLSAVNVEHGIRGESSLRDSEFVANLCESKGVPLYRYSINVPQITGGASLEEVARAERYRIFRGILSEDKADFVATAHHASDNAESVLFHLFRGCTVTGAGGIHEFVPCEGGKGFIRPMLSVTKREIEEYLKDRKAQFCEDETNSDILYTRNYLRHEVLAPAKKEFPSLEKNIYAFSRFARQDDEYLFSLAKEQLSESDKEVSFPEDLTPPLFGRCVVLALKKLGVSKDYTSKTIESVQSLKDLQNGAKMSLLGGITAVKEYGKITLFYAKEKECFEFPFGEGEFEFGECKLNIRLQDAKEVCFASKDKERSNLKRELFIDADKLPENCVIRTRREGDIFEKFGGGRKKLKEYLIDNKIPERKRCEIPLIASGSEILAVCGVEISDRVKIDGNTVRVYRLGF